jgi:hypothetical protein
MIRNLKALGLVLAAVCAMGALMASGAQARTFTASSYPASGSGGQKTEHVFTVQGQTVKCAKANFTGELKAASHSITIFPTYTECTAFGFLEATVTMNSCHYEFTIADSSTVPPTTDSVHIRCTKAGDTITVVGGTCTVHIPEQTPTVNVVDYANSEGGVLVTSTVEGIHSSTTDGFLCPLSSTNTTDTTGKYTGSTLFKGLNGVTVDVG